jgi:hypothetical protein
MTVKCGAYLVLPINGTEVKHFKSFPYLGSRVTIYGADLEDVHTHNKKVNVKLPPVWRNKNILLRTKIQFFNTNGKSGILFRCGMQKITQLISNSCPAFVN